MCKAAGDKSDAPPVRAVTDSLMDMERVTPGSCEALVSRLLQRLGRSTHAFCILLTFVKCSPLYIDFFHSLTEKCLCSSKESSLKALQDLAERTFIKSTIPNQDAEANLEVGNRKKQSFIDTSEDSNLSPLAKFLLTRFGNHVPSVPIRLSFS